MDPGVDRARTIALLQQTLVSRRNADGGWPYTAGHASRLEPTCWAIVALSRASASAATLGPVAAWVSRCQQASGWLVENARWPVNISFNAMAAFMAQRLPGLLAGEPQTRLLAAVAAAKGVAAPPSEALAQDNSLQGWGWIDGTFSWVEPTCWGLLALKRARAAGAADARMAARIDEGERLLIDRCCRGGGWNFGNARVMYQDLRPYIPPTALGLLAMQDRRNDPAVARSLDFLDQHWGDEPSLMALGLASLCLERYGRPTERITAALVTQSSAATDVQAMAIALCALTGSAGGSHVFAI